MLTLIVAALAGLAASSIDTEVRHWRAMFKARRQAAWDTHIDQALHLGELALYDRVAHDMVAGIDTEWDQANTDGWAVQ